MPTLSPLDQINRKYGLTGLRLASQQSYTPEEPSSLLGTLGRGAMSGISALGNTLDLPGSSIRDLLAGENPFDQYLSPFSAKNRTTGRGLMEKYGLLNRNRPGLDVGDVLGFAGEVALDPLTYMTFGASALTKGGKALQKAGMLDDVTKVGAAKLGKPVGKRVARMNVKVKDMLDPVRFGGDTDALRAATGRVEAAAKGMGKSLDELLDERVGGLMGLGVPFAQPRMVLGKPSDIADKTSLAEKVAGKMDKGAAKVMQSVPTRFTRMLLDPAVMDTYDPTAQKVAQLATKNLPKGRKEALESIQEAYRQMDELQTAYEDVFAPEIQQGLMGFQEGKNVAQQTKDVFGKIFRLILETPEAGRAGSVRGAFADIAPGLSVPSTRMQKQFADVAKEWQRVKNDMFEMVQKKGAPIQDLDIEQLFEIEHFPRFRNQDVYEKSLAAQGKRKLLPVGGGPALPRTYETRTLKENTISKLAKNERYQGKDGAANILEDFGDELDPRFAPPGEDKIANAASARQTHAEYLQRWAKEHKGLELYRAQPADDLKDYALQVHRMNTVADAAHETFFDMGVREADNLDAWLVAKPLDRAFREAGFTDKAVAHFLELHPDAADMKIPQEAIDGIKAVLGSSVKSEWSTRLGRALDTVNKHFRGMFTLPWPAFHIRNHTSGQYVNMSTGLMQSPKDLMDYAKAYKDSISLYRKGGKELDEMFTNGVFTGERGEKMMNVGFEDVSLQTDLSSPFWKRGPARRAVSKGYETVLGTGAKAMEAVEFMNRAPLYLYLKRKGWDGLQAATEVEKRHFDYGRLSEFERTVAKRGILFYSFSRRFAPLMAETLATKPGGAMAQTIKAATRARGQEEGQPIPDYLRETTSIPMGKDKEGGLRYLTGLGLPFEDTLAFGASPMEEALSRTAPYIKAPAELAFGRSLFQRGRPLEDLDPGAGRTIANIKQLVTGEKTDNAKPLLGSQGLEFALANSPLSRMLSTARTVTDHRKGLAAKAVNLGTGVKLTDVSPQVQDAIIREEAQKLMKDLGAKRFIKTYFPAEDKEKMTPQELEKALKLEGLMELLKQRATTRASER